MSRKVFIEVTAKHTVDGQIIPLSLTWEDGAKYQIDRVLAVEKRAALKVGGAGIRYTCRIRDAQRYLFLEGNKWFLESLY